MIEDTLLPKNKEKEPRFPRRTVIITNIVLITAATLYDWYTGKLPKKWK